MQERLALVGKRAAESVRRLRGKRHASPLQPNMAELTKSVVQRLALTPSMSASMLICHAFARLLVSRAQSRLTASTTRE